MSKLIKKSDLDNISSNLFKQVAISAPNISRTQLKKVDSVQNRVNGLDQLEMVKKMELDNLKREIAKDEKMKRLKELKAEYKEARRKSMDAKNMLMGAMQTLLADFEPQLSHQDKIKLLIQSSNVQESEYDND